MKLHPTTLVPTLAALRIFLAATGAAEPAAQPAAFQAGTDADRYRREANAGNLDALIALGDCYERGTGGEESNAELALRCYAEASRRGSAAAHYQMALCFAAGIGTASDETRALQLLRESAQRGHAPAQAALAAQARKPWLGEFDYMRRVTKATPRLGDEATRFFQAISADYRMRGTVFPETPSLVTIAAAAHSTDPAFGC